MSEPAYIALKCFFAILVMVVIHFVSKTPHYFLAGLALSFPGLSLVTYYFMFRERGAADVRTTALFGLCAAVPFMAFLLTLHLTVKVFNIVASLAMALSVWLVLSVALVAAWRQWH